MGFEFDPKKSDLNLAKHGISFIDAQQLWDDPNLLEIPARTEDEPRSIVIELIRSQHWSAIVTARGGDTRIISVRRSRIEEVALYES